MKTICWQLWPIQRDYSLKLFLVFLTQCNNPLGLFVIFLIQVPTIAFRQLRELDHVNLNQVTSHMETHSQSFAYIHFLRATKIWRNQTRKTINPYPEQHHGSQGWCFLGSKQGKNTTNTNIAVSSKWYCSKFDTLTKSLFVPNSNYDLKCRWRGWRCTTTRSTRSTPTPSTVSPSRWPGTPCPSLLSFLLRFNLGPTSLLGPVQWKSFKPIGCPWKNFALNLLEGWVTMSEREVKPSPSAIPQTNLKLSFFGTPCTTLLFAIHAIQLSVPHHTLLLFHFWQLFDLQKYFPLEIPLLSVIFQTLRTSYC